jgi:hypothetical protein
MEPAHSPPGVLSGARYFLATLAQPAFFFPLAPTHRQSPQPLQANSSLTSVAGQLPIRLFGLRGGG